MKIEKLVSNMMTINVKSRLWHWNTLNAQHHVTYENFLKANELFTDSLVESALGNECSIDFKNVGVAEGQISEYKHKDAVEELKSFRAFIAETKKALDADSGDANQELSTILDDVTENTSKALYLLRLK